MKKYIDDNGNVIEDKGQRNYDKTKSGNWYTVGILIKKLVIQQRILTQ